MPYDNLADLPPNLKATLKNKGWSTAKKRKFLDILNALLRDGMEEGPAIATALKKAGKMKLSHYCVTDAPPGRFLLIADSQVDGKRFRKELARPGSFTHPWGRLDFTPQRLASWVETFRQMKAAGIEVPIPLNHSEEPMDNVGWVLDMSLAGDILLADLVITEPVVADRIDNGSIRFTSIGITPELTDDAGNKWDDAIFEVALVRDPHIRVQEGFIALSRATEGEDQVTIEQLQAENDALRKELAELKASAKTAGEVEGLEVRLSAAEVAKGTAETERDELKAKVETHETEKFESEVKTEVLTLTAAGKLTKAEEEPLTKTLLSLRATPEARANVLKLYADRKPAPTTAKTALGSTQPDGKADLKLAAVTEAARLDNLSPEDYITKLSAKGFDPERMAWFTIHKDGTPFPDDPEGGDK